MKLFTTLLCLLSILDIGAYHKLTEQDIKEIYTTFVQCNFTMEYRTRYVPLPLEKNILSWAWEGKDLPRVIALLEFEKFVIENNISSKKALAINGSDPEWNYLPTKEIAHIDYEKDPYKYDLHTLDLEEKNFDFIMVNQTLEHLYDPLRCLKNLYKHIQPNGILYLNVPANTIPHDTPCHFYTGFTPVGLGALVKLAGFKILSIGQWGNSKYLQKMHETNDWPDYRQFTTPGLNETDYCPLITWIFAIKQESI